MFGLRVDLARPDSRHEIVACCGKELLLHQIENLHGCHDGGCIGIGRSQLPALALDKGLAEFDLGLDRDLVLAVGGVAGIKQNVLRHVLNSIFNIVIVETGRCGRPVWCGLLDREATNWAHGSLARAAWDRASRQAIMARRQSKRSRQ
ncbi:hypothetical protein RMR16_013555 [Agrobacterium sp. rho-13.3]|uniref:hypothetical protein n=1 Tax=Agrobacterium sp. rho-13.3 TaxID=3072980 RepID=UPI002A14DE56|nr:hypothetical protein [Agrobacterium sp. rho-13.3]MDX8309909.1 hypothetical protein [Agrobacterium sp. rho-13.3]